MTRPEGEIDDDNHHCDRCGPAGLRRAGDRPGLAPAAAARGRREGRGRDEPLRRAGVPRPGHQRRSAGRVHAQLRPARGGLFRARRQRAGRAASRARSTTSAISTATTRCCRATIASACSSSATCCGTPTARTRRFPPSTRCFRRAPFRIAGAIREFADMRAAWDTLDAETQALIRDMICEHSRLFSRGELGFTFNGRRAAQVRAGAAATRAAASCDRQAFAVSCPRTAARSSAGRCPRGARCCAN